MAKAQNIRVGLFAAVALGLLAVVLIVFGGMRFWERSSSYHIVFDRTVMGLENGAVVYLNGMRVGSVTGLDVDRDDLRKVAVTIEVGRDTPVRADTHAYLQYAGITGLKVIDLRDGTAASPRLPPGGRIAVGDGLLDKLEREAQALVEETNGLMRRTGGLMQQASDVMQRAATLTDRLIAMTAPAELTATRLAQMSSSLQAMVDENRVALRQSLAAVRHTAEGASALIDDRVAPLFAGAGDFVTELRRLVSANEGPLRAAVFDLRQASRSFKELARDVRQRPSRLLFSSEPSERKLP